jgi:hypothetical protein
MVRIDKSSIGKCLLQKRVSRLHCWYFICTKKVHLNLIPIQHRYPNKEFCSNPKLRLQHLLYACLNGYCIHKPQKGMDSTTSCLPWTLGKGYTCSLKVLHITQRYPKVWMAKKGENYAVTKRWYTSLTMK